MTFNIGDIVKASDKEFFGFVSAISYEIFYVVWFEDTTIFVGGQQYPFNKYTKSIVKVSI